MDINKLLIDQNSSILVALKQLNSLRNVTKLILFVVDADKKVIGSITDGDIRRSLVLKRDLTLKVSLICNKNFFHLKNTNQYVNLKYFLDKGVLILPVIGEKGKISRFLDISNVKSILPLECVIMAGGRGKRLSPITDKIPKPLLLLNDKSILERNIDNLASFGIYDFHISINYLGDLIRNKLNQLYSDSLKIKYVEEAKPLGTIGALSNIKQIKSDAILVVNGDTITNFNYEDFYLEFIESNADMAIASKDFIVDVPYAILDIDNDKNVKNFKEKPSYTYKSNAGIYLIKKNVLKLVPKNCFYDATDLIQKLLELRKKIIHKTINGYWIDIGSKEDYKRAKDFFKYKSE